MDPPRHPAQRFDDRVADYADARPRYPDELVHVVASLCDLAPGAAIADIGAGTGLSARPFLRHGYVVACVEPNARMRAAAERELASFPGFRSMPGSGEATGLDDDSVDCVLVAQAFHWLDGYRARREIARVLRPGGRACLVWNTRRTTGTRFLARYEDLVREFATDYDTVRRRTDAVIAGLAAFFRSGFTSSILENRQQLDLEGLKRRVRSASYMPAEGSARHEPMMRAVTALFDAEHRDGRVHLAYDLEIHCGRLEAVP